MMRLYLFVLIVFISISSLVAQKNILKGTVKDAYSNQPLEFVNLIVLGTNIGTTTDIEGKFELEIEGKEFVQLQLSFLGYKSLITEEVMISSVRSNYIEVFLEPTSESLEEVTVKPSAFVQKIESPVSLRRIGVDQIEKSAGANRDISKVIQSFPGVGGSVSFRNDIIVRGGGPSENRFFIDGIEVPTINHFSTQGASGGPVGILNVDFIREVDFYSGAFPINSGNALSSVMDIKQKDGSSDQTDYKAVLGASEIAFSATGPLGDKTTGFVSVRRSYLQLLFKALDLPFLPTFTDFQFKTKTKFNTKNEITFLGFGAIDDFELNTGASDSPENKYILSYIPVNKQWSYTVGVNYKHYFESSYLSFIASRNHLNNEAIKYQDNIEKVENLTYDYDSFEKENKFRLEYNARRDGFSLTSGVSLESVNYHNSTYRLNFNNNNVQAENYTSDIDFIKYAAFGNVSIPGVFNRVNLSLAIRLDGANYSNKMSNLLEQFSPRFSASVRLTDKLLFNTNAGKYFQLPPLTSLGYRDENQNLLNKENGLKYLTASHYVAGIELRPNNSSKITLEGFYKNYRNYPFSISDSIAIASKGGDFGVLGDEELIPTGEGRAFGAELLIRRRSGSGLNYLFAYTFVRSEFKDAKGQYVPSAWDSKHILTTSVNKSFKRNWDLGLKWRFLGGLPYTPIDEDKTTLKVAWDAKGREYLDYNQFNEERLDAFHQLDIRVDKKYDFKSWNLGVYLDIQNVYSYSIQEPVKYVPQLQNGEKIIVNPEDPVQSQRYAFDKIFAENGTLLPTIGVIVEF